MPQKVEITTNKPLGPQLRELRESQGISVRELARRMGVTHDRISLLERDHNEPMLSTFVLIFKTLGVREIVFRISSS